MIHNSSNSVAPFHVHEEHPFSKNYNKALDAKSLLSAAIDDGDRLKQLFDLYNEVILYGTEPAKEGANWLIDIIQKDFLTILKAVVSARDQLHNG